PIPQPRFRWFPRVWHRSRCRCPGRSQCDRPDIRTLVRCTRSSARRSGVLETSLREEELEEFLAELREGEEHPHDFEKTNIGITIWTTSIPSLSVGMTLKPNWSPESRRRRGRQWLKSTPLQSRKPSRHRLQVLHSTFEPPVLRIMQPQKPVQPDKIVQLEEHRSRSRDNLTPGEQAAFAEIARKLDPLGLRTRRGIAEPDRLRAAGLAYLTADHALDDHHRHDG
ncbi:MAG: hypothetical protein U5L74_11945, partial [Ideonella sp.]|nr:hypothetical protein [Ideonella sp.]